MTRRSCWVSMLIFDARFEIKFGTHGRMTFELMVRMNERQTVQACRGDDDAIERIVEKRLAVGFHGDRRGQINQSDVGGERNLHPLVQWHGQRQPAACMFATYLPG